MVGVSASINLPLHHKVQKFSSDTGSPGWSRKNGRKMVAVWWWSRPLLRCCWQYSYLLLIIAKIIVQWQSLMETPNPACYQLMINMINSAMHTKAFHMRPVMELKWYYVITSRIHTSHEAEFAPQILFFQKRIFWDNLSWFLQTRRPSHHPIKVSKLRVNSVH